MIFLTHICGRTTPPFVTLLFPSARTRKNVTDILRADSDRVPSFAVGYGPRTRFRRCANDNYYRTTRSFHPFLVLGVVKNKNKLNRYSFLRAPSVPYGSAKARRFVRPVFTPLCTTAKAHVRIHTIHKYSYTRCTAYGL